MPSEQELIQKGADAIRANNFGEAILHFNEVLSTKAHHIGVLRLRAICHYKLGKYENVIADLNIVFARLKDESKLVSSWQIYGISKANLAKYAEAIDVLNKVIVATEAKPEAEAEVYLYRGLCKVELKKSDEAISDFKQALKHGDRRAYYSLGYVLAVQLKHSEALPYLDQAIADNPQSAEAYKYRGWSNGELGDQKQALKDLEQALKLNPSDSETYLFLAWNRAELGQFKEAITDLLKANAFNPSNSQVQRTLGWCKLRLGQYQEAIRHLDKAAILNPEDPEIYRFRGWCKEQLKDYIDAAEDYKKRMSLSPESAGSKRAFERVQGILSGMALHASKSAASIAAAPSQ
ncbi:MAG: Tetratricopeptide 2 repeat protein [Gammaproteobacteria bacterium]|jgi:tetratricopeptide (TPR) repeat protein|nr:Tetratricopeptide 2 repeat protein [Gammaproteobacteria bacterium]